MIEHNDPQDKELAALYRASAQEMPSAGLDARILAAARSVAPAAKLKPVSWSQRWRTPVAVAATLVVTATLTLLVQDEQNGRLAKPDKLATAEQAPSRAPAAQRQAAAPAVPAQPTAPAPLPPAPAAALPAALPSSAPQAPAVAVQTPVMQDRALSAGSVAGEDRKALQEPASRNEARVETQAAAPRPATPAPAPAAREAAANIGIRGSTEAMPVPEPESRERRDELRAPTAAKTAPVPAPAAQAAPAARRPETLSSTEAKDRAARTPTQWIAEIRKLRQEGKSAEAAASLAEFKKLYPWYELPEDLQAR